MKETTLDLRDRFERETGETGFFARFSADTRTKEAAIVTKEIEKLIRSDETQGLTYAILPPHCTSTATWGERLQLPYKNKLLCADKAHNRAKFVEYLARKKSLKIYDFEINEIKDVGLKIQPSELKDKVFEQQTDTGTFTAAGSLMYGDAGAIIGAMVGGLIEKLFPKEFHVHIQLRLVTRQKLDMRYLWEQMIYSEETEASLQTKLNSICSHLGILLSFLDNHIGRPVKKLWMTPY